MRFGAKENIDLEYLLHDYDKLVSCQSLGFYNSCETITIFLFQKSTNQSINVFTIFVFEEKITTDEVNEYLTKKPIRITDDYSLGIERKVKSLEAIREIYISLCQNRNETVVDIGEGNIKIGRIEGVPKIFIQQDSTKEIIMNKVLKNNFHNGSYILEFFDVEKKVKSIFSTPQYKKMTSEIYKVIPIDLFSVSDRIGNFIFQFPSLNTSVTYSTDQNEMQLDYHIYLDHRLDNVTQFQLQSEIEYDDNILGFGTRMCNKEMKDVTFQMGNSSQLCKTTFLDINNQLILSRQETTFMRHVSMPISVGTHYGEQREIYDEDGRIKDQFEIRSVENINTNEPITRERKKWISMRQYTRRMEELYNRREFRRYGKKTERKEAIQDVVSLMNLGSGGKVYLWDPYLTVEDLLQTWYYTTSFGMPLYAITSSEIAEKNKLSVSEWISKEKQFIENRSNHYGINLELRCQWNGHGCSFHDRFLMLLKKNKKPRVWSLGTSVNSIGKKHHVIQNVEHPQLLVDTFEELWKELEADECLVWK